MPALLSDLVAVGASLVRPLHCGACRVLTAGALLAVPAVAGAGPKVDHVVLENGDRLACEIKGLERGRLSISTDAFDTVRVYWDRLQHVASPRLFEVERTGGARHYGALVDAGPRRVRVAPIGTPGIELAFDEVVRITPVETTLDGRLDGHLDFGFTFAKASREARLTINGDATLRTRHFEGTLVVASQLSRRDDAPRIARNSASAYGIRRIGRRWSVLALGQIQENEELALNLRTVLGGGAGRHVVQSNRAMLHVFAGIAHTRERFEGVPASGRAELVAGTTFDWFSARDNHVDVSTQLIGYSAVGGPARQRLESQGAVRWEFFGDFYLSLNGYASYDSRPPDGRSGADVGLSTTLGWSF